MINGIHDFFTGKNILVTGGNGYLGSNLINILKSINCKITILDRITGQNLENFNKAKIKECLCDIRDPDIWAGILDGIDLIFYFAGQTSVYKANENPKDDFAINVQPLSNLLEACRKYNCKPGILFSGTVTENGIPEKFPVNEMHPDKPVTVYDLHKLIAEYYLKCYSNRGIVQGAILRLANVYGPGPLSTNADRGILNMMVRRALNREELTLYGEGNFLRDYIFIDDVINAFLLSAMNMGIMNGNHFIVASGVSHSIREAFEIVRENVQNITNRNVKLISIEPPENLSPIESRNFVADISYLRDLVGWNPTINLNLGIITTIKYYYDDKN
jgi:UDP-glucose 4-epimerase